MIDHRQVKIACVLHRPPHYPGVRHGTPVVRNGDRTGGFHLAHFGEFRAVRRFCDRTDRENIGEAGTLRLLDHVSRDRGVVVDRICVRHRTNARPTAGNRRRTAGRDRFFMLLPRLAQMDVHVDKTRSNDQAGSVKNLGHRRVRSFGQATPRPLPVLNEKALPLFWFSAGSIRWPFLINNFITSFVFSTSLQSPNTEPPFAPQRRISPDPK